MIWMNQVKQMYSVGSLPDDMRWLVILGDDVYINTARLYYFLAGYASRDDHPVIFAHAPQRQSLAASEIHGTLKKSKYLICDSLGATI